MITQSIIGYRISGASEKRVYAFDPVAMATLPEAFFTAHADEVNEAITLAHSAWRVFRQLDGKARASFLLAIASGIEELGDELINRVRLETAYPAPRILTERNRTCAQLRLFAGIAATNTWHDIVIDEALPDRMPSPRPDLRRMMLPMGPVVVFGASNFPLAYSTAGGDVASALAVGCPVVVKAHDSHLGTNALVAEVIMQAAIKTGMPEGVFSSLIGDGFETGRLLVEHPLVAAAGFTGSQSGGRALYDIAQKRKSPIPVFAEMGSINPVFLLPEKVKENAASLASSLAASMTMTVGQFCTNPGLMVIMDDEPSSLFLEHLTAELEKVPDAVMLNAGILHNFRSGISKVQSEEGIQIAHARNVQEANTIAPVLAKVPASVFISHPQLHHEIFGPFSLVVMCETWYEMKEVADILEGQLTASVYATVEEKERIGELVQLLIEKVGRIIYNGVPTGVEVSAAMTHGGPYPASTDGRFTAVGHAAVKRWIRPVTFQSFHPQLLPDVLKG